MTQVATGYPGILDNVGRLPEKSVESFRLVQGGAGAEEPEYRNRSEKAVSVVGDEPVLAVHRADRSAQHRGARVLECVSGAQVWLLADHSVALDFLHVAVAVGDDPVAREELRRNQSRVVNGDAVSKEVLVRGRIGAGRDERRLRVYVDAVVRIRHEINDSTVSTGNPQHEPGGRDDVPGVLPRRVSRG